GLPIFPPLLAAGINDWGGVSPVTADHVNPEAPWPQIATLERATAAAGYTLVPRLAVYPEYAEAPERWVDAGLVKRVLDAIDTTGFAREDDWVPGDLAPPPAKAPSLSSPAGGRGMERPAPHSTNAILPPPPAPPPP